MQPYSFEAIDASGRRKKGVLTADSDAGARRDLRRQGLTVLSVAQANKAASGNRDISFGRKKLSFGDRSRITRQLAAMIGAGAPVEEALHMAAHQADKPHMTAILLSVRGHVIEGERFATALSAEKSSFDRFYRAVVSTAENTGTLPQVLNHLADYLEKQHEMRGKIRTALIYPTALTITALTVITILMIFVVPRVVEQLTGAGQSLPALTRGLILISDFLVRYGLYMLILIAFSLIAVRGLLKQPAARLRWHGFLLKSPIIGPLIRKLESARLAGTMGTLLAAGSPLLDALKAGTATLKNEYLRKAADQMAVEVEAGKSLSHTLKDSGSFLPMVGYMAAAGENSGTIDQMLIKTSEYLEREFDQFTTATLSLLEPAIIITMGIIVALIVLSILLPILQLNTASLI